MTTRGKRIALLLSIAVLLGAWILTIDGNFVRGASRVDPRAAQTVARFGASWEDVSIASSDGVSLKGWLFTPRSSNHRAVMFVHGRGGTRQNMLERVQRFLSLGYTCLAVDQRGSGTSGGIFSFGLHEPGDQVRWAQWLRNRIGGGSVFAYGASRGSTTLVQSLAGRPPLTGVAVESTGAGNIGRPYSFAGDRIGLSESVTRLILWPLMEPSFAWVALRHGVDLRKVRSGVEAVRKTSVPLLIIQGADDQNTPLKGAVALRDANPQQVELVVIRGADHDWFSSGRPEVMNRVAAWFDDRAIGR